MYGAVVLGVDSKALVTLAARYDETCSRRAKTDSATVLTAYVVAQGRRRCITAKLVVHIAQVQGCCRRTIVGEESKHGVRIHSLETVQPRPNSALYRLLLLGCILVQLVVLLLQALL